MIAAQMNLGQLLRHLDDDGSAADALEALGDLVLFAAVAEMGERHDETPGVYTANASRRFAALAGDEDWLGLMSAMERAENPARAALERMLHWSLARDAEALAPPAQAGGCSCGGGGGGCHGHATS